MGPAAARISGVLQQAIDKLDPLPGHIAGAVRVRAMLAHVAKTLFVGVMNDCFFDPATALCLKGKTETATPAMAQRRPDRCPNSCITSRHRPMWAKAIAEGEDLLRQTEPNVMNQDRPSSRRSTLAFLTAAFERIASARLQPLGALLQSQ
jgi:hypothetical protein